MDIAFKYKEIIDNIKMLAAFEGREYVNTEGKSLFQSIIVTEQDFPLVKSYIHQAINSLQEQLARMILYTTQTDDETVWQIRGEQTRYNPSTQTALQKHLYEAVASYAMMKWMEERKPSRVAMYADLWQGSSQLAAKNIFRKDAPRKRIVSHADIDEVTIKVQKV